ncbi:MAG: 50S ribosomal protein L11 methyltransferase [Planctomycetota bacterium]
MSGAERAHARSPGEPADAWIVEASVDARVGLPGGEMLDRDDLHAWMWERADGLVGIDEGNVSVDEAARHGLTPTPRVIDAAAAPAERDWVAGLPVARVAWWFDDEASARAAAALVATITGCRVVRVGAECTTDHEAAARAAFGPVAVAGFGTVRPAWEAGLAGRASDGAVTIFVEPGSGFGTGLHETTQLCLAALAEWHRRGSRLGRILDFGSGSGILGIAAAVCGADHVAAIEIDDRVHDAIRANARRNGVATRVQVRATLGLDAGPYDLVVANIVAPVLAEHADDLCRRVTPRGGGLVLSGLTAHDAPAVAARYAERLGHEPQIRERGDWRCLVFTRP